MPEVLLDGRPVDLSDAPNLAEALRSAGVHLPALCHDERLAPTGACRLCLVRIDGHPRPVPACATPVTAGLQIETATPDLEAARRGVLQMLASGYPAGPVRSDPGKPFHREIAAHGLEEELTGQPDPARVDRSHPYITVDMSRCILCERCVRICDQVQGQFVWHVRDRGCETRIEPDGPSLLESSCVSCGACVDTCPTGALEDAAFETLGAATAWTETVCPYCGTGCEVSIGTRDDKIVSARPVGHSAVSKGHLCVKGRYAFEFVDAADRVREPMIREGGAWRRAGWDEALAFTAAGLRRVIERDGPDAIGVLGSARQTNEENYLTQKFARAVIGTNNVDCCARVCHAPSATALKRALGAGLSTNSFDDIERARVILVCGANPTENHPVVGARIKQAVRSQGARLIVIDPRNIELAHYADHHLRVRPGANIPLLNAMAHVIVSEGLVDRAFIEARIDQYDAFVESLLDWTPERAAAICDVEPRSIRDAARLYATVGPAMIVNGLGATEHVQGTDAVSALINLALLTGNIGKPGSGVNALRGQNNVQGAAHMGCEPNTLPGSTPLGEGRAALEALWNQPIPGRRGLHALEMLDRAMDGQLKALWVIGYDIASTNPNTAHTEAALGTLDFVVVQDLFMNETASNFGSVFLPACSSYEKDGTFMNAERRIQLVRAAVSPRGDSKPDWQIICDLARVMGHARGFVFESPKEIWDEVRAACEGARGMTYERLSTRGLQWPCPSDDHPGTAILHTHGFATGQRAALRAVKYGHSPEERTAEFPYILNTGRSLYQFNAGTMTMRGHTSELRPTDVLDISHADAAALRVESGERVRLRSRYGSAVLPVHVNDSVRAGEFFATFQAAGSRVNSLTSSHCDTVTGTPEYKITAVAIEKI